MSEAADILLDPNEDRNGNRLCRPFLKWAGGKTNLLPELLPRIPLKYSRYFEPFLGGGAVLFRTRPAHATAYDGNAELINVFQVVKSSVDELIHELAPYVYDKEFFYRVRNLDRTEKFSESSPVQRAARFIYLNRTCFNGLYRVNSKGHFNVPFGRYDNPTIFDAPSLRACSRVLASVTLRSVDFAEVTNEVTSDDFVYFDPPYYPISETSSFAQYTNSGFDGEMHRRLAEVCSDLDRRKVRFMLSNSDSPFVRSLYESYRIEMVEAPRAINSRAEKRGAVSELIIRNY